MYTVPVYCTRDDREGRVWLSEETMRALVIAVPSIKVQYDEKFKILQDQIFFAINLSPAY